MKKIQILTFLLAVFTVAINAKGFSKNDYIKRKKQSHNPVQLDLQSNKNRLLGGQESQKIRITYDFSAINTIQNKQIKNLVEENIKITIQFYADMVKVKYPVSKPFRIPKDSKTCYDMYTYSEQQKSMEFKDTDLHILVTFVDNPDEWYLAYAAGCISDDTGRNILGIVNFNIGYISSFSDFDFYNSLVTTQHELFHVIAFNTDLFTKFEISKGVKFSKDNYNKGLLKFPEVLKWARNHYNCQDLEGMPVEDEGSGSSAGVHWEKSVLYDETMDADGDEGFWSDLNNALMQDSGWYEVDRSYHDIITYGKGQGCDFVINKCSNKKKQYKEFCSKQGEKGPSISYHAASVCSNTDKFTNGCFMMKPEKTCFNPANNDNAKYQEYKEYFGYNSRVFYSSLAPLSKNTNEQLMCYKYECVGDSQINVYFGDYKLECKTNFEKIDSPDTNNFKGYLKCPDIKDFCSKQQKCPQYCSSKGYCIKGECVCLEGYSGPGCQCPPSQYYDTKTKACNKCADEINCSHCDSSNSSICIECKIGFFLKDGQCQQCSDSCKSCSESADNCISCLIGFNLIQNKCSACPSQCETCSGDNSSTCFKCVNGKGFDEQNKCTINCSSNCKTCNIQADICLTCYEGMYLKDNKCVCSDGTYFDSKSNSCKQCTYLCKKCQDGNSCDLCVDTYSIDPNTKNCSKCQDKFFENNKGVCEPCHPSCQACSGTATTCTKCYEDSKLVNQNKCQCLTSYQYIDNKGYCQNCKKGCQTCDSYEICTSCSQDYFLKNNKCQTCPQGQFANDKGECKPCDSSCSKCTGPLPNQCKSCKNQLYFNNIEKTCEKCDRDGYFKSKDYTCQKCNSKCLTCQNSADECLTVTCSVGQYAEQNKVCKDCSANCEKCTSAQECQICKSGFTLNTQYQCVSQQEKEVISCQQGQYQESNTSCKDCSANCEQCINQNECQKCKSGFDLNPDKQCVTQTKQEVIQCKAGQYVESNKCKDCSTSCETCTSVSECQICKSGFDLNPDKQCVDQNKKEVISCQVGQYVESNKCKDCSTSCETCTSVNECQKCKSGFDLNSQKQCVTQQKEIIISCNVGQYNESNKCKDCNASCETCTSANECQKCKSGFELNSDKQCITQTKQEVISCQVGQYVESNKCKDCSTSCETCTSENECQKCKAGFVFNSQKQCVTQQKEITIQCNIGQYNESNKCKDCNSSCETCTSASECQKCKSGFDLNSQKQCVAQQKETIIQCSVGQYIEQNKCKDCSSSCETCTNVNECKKCKSGYDLNSQKQCVIQQIEKNIQCKIGQYEQNKTCKDCSTNCSECKDANECLKCNSGFDLSSEKKCVLQTETVESKIIEASFTMLLSFNILLLLLLAFI